MTGRDQGRPPTRACVIALCGFSSLSHFAVVVLKLQHIGGHPASRSAYSFVPFSDLEAFVPFPCFPSFLSVSRLSPLSRSFVWASSFCFSATLLLLLLLHTYHIRSLLYSAAFLQCFYSIESLQPATLQQRQLASIIASTSPSSTATRFRAWARELSHLLLQP